MATDFPGAIDSFTNPTASDYLNSPSHAGQHANANDAIEALEAKVGKNSSAVTSSHDYKLSEILTTDKSVGKVASQVLTNKSIDADDNTIANIGNSELNTVDGDIGGDWKAWTVNWVNLIIGNGTVEAKYTQIGKTVHARMSVTLGSTSSISGAVTFNFPVTSVAYAGATHTIGTAGFLEAGVAGGAGLIGYSTTTRAKIWAVNSGGAYLVLTDLSSTIPFTWGTGDKISCTFTYEAV